MSGTFSADHLVAGLKQFQRDTVEHVMRRFYDDEQPTRRFLVADETGLGKSMVARGVIARTIERLQHDDACPRIDVIYVCSNADIAEQNLKRLDVLGGGTQHATRLTLLARDSGQLGGDPHPAVGKRVNLVSFTPGTSFDVAGGTGWAEERALLHVILCEELDFWNKSEQRASRLVLQDTAHKGFESAVNAAYDLLGDDGPDEAITQPFLAAARSAGLLRQFKRAVLDLGRRRSVTDDERVEYRPLIGALRAALAKAGVDALQPDLVILDEFQRFRHLLAKDDPRHREAAELADDLFNHGDTRVLLLSATPYKPFTYAEEAAAGDDHEADLRRTLGFLAATNGGADTINGIVDRLAEYRRAAVEGTDVNDLRMELESKLTRLMCRTERPRLGDDGMLRELDRDADPVAVEDVVSYAALRKIAANIDAPIAVDYWKSTPYFLNFCDGYKFGDKLRDEVADPEARQALRPLLTTAQHLNARAVHDLQPLDHANARLRRLADDTVGRGMWQLLWLPPSVPYVQPGGPYADPALSGVTKRLIFSSWAAAPTALAALLSHEATRRLAGGDREALEAATTTRRLDWRVLDGRPGAMTALALFWPAPALARRSTPFSYRAAADVGARTAGAEPWYWTTILADSGAAPDGLDVETATTALSGVLDDAEASDDPTRLDRHVELALALVAGDDPAAERRTGAPEDLDAVVTELGTFAPGNIALRCIDRLAGSFEIDETTRWRAAAILSSALRSLFNRTEALLLLDQLLPGEVYWRAVLRYCASGNLEATLDEYLHHLAEADRAAGLDGEKLLALAEAARAAITPRPSRYEAFDPLHPTQRIAFPSRFALRYGSKRAGNEENARQPEIRHAFNSPFWPFVLATTSIGQEGIDLHWWCHAAVHWNTPASPVDFEQREGRVHRYGGHAIRKNLAEQHGEAILEATAKGAHPWDEAYRLGMAEASDRFGELAPHWITEGSTKIERHVLPYPLSHDHDRYRRLKDDLALYRLTFGQPRQEDMVELLRRRGAHLSPRNLDELRLDLRPRAGRRPDDDTRS